DALGATLGEAALVEDQHAVVAAEFGIDLAEQFPAQGGVLPRGLAEEDLHHADLGGLAVDLQGDGLGGLVVVVVQQQAARGGAGALGPGVVAEQGGEAGDELLEEWQGLPAVGGGHNASRGWEPGISGEERPPIGYEQSVAVSTAACCAVLLTWSESGCPTTA